MTERRKFSRIVYSAPASLFQGSVLFPTRLLDISLKGALVDTPANWSDNDQITDLVFRLNESEVDIQMQVQPVRVDDDLLHLKCVQIDIDSISHLRRLIELNVQDESLLHRELEELSKPLDSDT